MQTRSLKVRTLRDEVGARLTSGDGKVGILLAHGAGVGQHHDWMVSMRKLLAEQGHPVMTFDYAYTAAGRKAPDRLPRLLEVHEAAFTRFGEYVDDIVLAGKSMGGRVGAHLVDERGLDAHALVYYGYPLVPMGRGEPRPTDHLERIRSPQLFFCGTRDRLSPPDAVADVAASLPDATVEVIDGADHSFNVPKSTGRTGQEAMRSLAVRTSSWLGGSNQSGGGR